MEGAQNVQMEKAGRGIVFYIADSDTPNRILDLPYYSFRMDQFYKLGLYDPGI